MLRKLQIPIRNIHVTFYRGKQTIDYSRVPVLNDEDLEEKFVKGSGPGGQSVNKTVNCVVLTHKPTGMYDGATSHIVNLSGLVVKCHESRLLHQNREKARNLMITKLDKLYNAESSVEEQRCAIKAKKSLEHDRRRHKLEELKRSWKEREGLS